MEESSSRKRGPGWAKTHPESMTRELKATQYARVQGLGATGVAGGKRQTLEDPAVRLRVLIILKAVGVRKGLKTENSRRLPAQPGPGKAGDWRSPGVRECGPWIAPA